jgi:hypothetical protein
MPTKNVKIKTEQKDKNSELGSTKSGASEKAKGYWFIRLSSDKKHKGMLENHFKKRQRQQALGVCNAD